MEIKKGLCSKTVKASLNSERTETFTDMKQSKMFQQIETPRKCPVAAFEMYFMKLSKNQDEVLFPKPLSNFSSNSWYSDRAVRGKDYIGNFMKTLSKKLNLSKSYTNHSIRSTVISNIIDAGHDVSDVAAVTGHKSTEALRKYASRKRESQMRTCSSTLNYTLHGGISESKSDETRDDKIENDNEPSTKKLNLAANMVSEISHANIASLFGSGNQIKIDTVNINIRV